MPFKVKFNFINTLDAQRMRLYRQLESREAKEQRLLKEKLRSTMARLNESYEAKQQRLLKEKLRRAEARRNQSREARLLKERLKYFIKKKLSRRQT